jgi:glycosyltransferase involved in cell wall biosynthesis
MRILLVSEMVPYLPSHDGFRLIAANLVRELCARHEYHLIAIALGNEGPAQLNWARNYCRSCSIIRTGGGASARFRALTGRADPTLARVVADAARSLQPEVIHLEGVGLASLLRDQPLPARALLCVHDSKSLRYREFARFAHSPRARARMRALAMIARRCERRWLRYADRVVVTSPADRDALASVVSPERLAVIANGVNLDYFAFRPAPEDGRIVFTGNMSWPPNEDAAEHFARVILPAVRLHAAGASFWIVGAEPSARVLALAKLPGVHVTGTVDDLRPWLQSAAVYVSPLRFGLGVKNKILEAMASGAPIVATSPSLSGTPLVHGEHLIVADGDAEIAAAVVEVLGDTALASSLSLAARRKVESEYSWSSVACKYEQLFLNRDDIRAA